ncbi:hypothetical protein N826_07195 [Skermanella aerolata KACC 11604]|nr:hypothetical protein N826_07195 [Skermanella aerolata KACC 11604]
MPFFVSYPPKIYLAIWLNTFGLKECKRKSILINLVSNGEITSAHTLCFFTLLSPIKFEFWFLKMW